MTRPLSNDLRKRVVRAVLGGESCRSVASRFGVSVSSVVKWAQQAPAPETLYESVVRAGEMAQRQPKGPTYLCVAMETMLHEWQKPDALRKVPFAPKCRPLPADRYEDVAAFAQAWRSGRGVASTRVVEAG